MSQSQPTFSTPVPEQSLVCQQYTTICLTWLAVVWKCMKSTKLQSGIIKICSSLARLLVNINEYTPESDTEKLRRELQTNRTPPLLTWNGLVVHQIKHDDKNTRPCNNESQDQDPGQRGAEGGVEVICKSFLGPSHRRRPGVSILGVDDHGGCGGRRPHWRSRETVFRSGVLDN